MKTIHPFETIDLYSDQAIAVILQMAKDELANLKKGESFAVSELFYGYHWKRIQAKDRKQLGRFFLGWAISEEGKRMLDVAENKTLHQQYYIKK